MTPLEEVLKFFDGLGKNRPEKVLMCGRLAHDPEVKKICKIESGHGSFMGISIEVVPNIVTGSWAKL